MNWDRIKAAIGIAEKLQYFFIASADAQGVPHVATAGKIAMKGQDVVEVSFWFCPKTMDNLEQNKHVALIIWDAENNSGYQVLGEVAEVQVAQVLDGYIPETSEGQYLPQAYWCLTVRVHAVMDFIHALHNDAVL